MELKKPRYTYTDKYNIDGATQQAVNSGFGTNSGYYFFENEEDCNVWLAASKRRKDVTDYFRGYNTPTNEQLDKIYTILFGDNHEQ